MAGWSAEYRAARVRRQLTPGPISSLRRTAGSPPFISFSTNYPDVRLFMTADFDCSRSGSFRTVFGARLRFLFAMECGLQLPWRKHYSVLNFLTSSAFLGTYLMRLPTFGLTLGLLARNNFRLHRSGSSCDEVKFQSDY